MEFTILIGLPLASASTVNSATVRAQVKLNISLKSNPEEITSYINPLQQNYPNPFSLVNFEGFDLLSQREVKMSSFHFK